MALDSTNAKRFAGLSEAKFREDVLIPLMKAMGYKDVDHYHGRLELGKDIVAWTPHSDGARDYVAIVAKVGNINASISGDAGIVTGQVKQAFGSRYFDKTTGEERRVHRVIVASTGSIKEQSQKAIRSQFTEEQNRYIKFWDGEKVAELMAGYLPERFAPDLLENVRQTLKGLEYFTVVPEVRPEGVYYRIESKEEGMVIWKAKFVFPETPEGNQAKGCFQRFMNEGERVTIPGEYIESFEKHEELTRIFGNVKPGSIELGLIVPSKPRPIRLVVDTVSGPITYDKLELRLTKSGQRRSEFQTTQENEPLFLSIVLDNSSDRRDISFSLQIEVRGQKVRRVWQAVRIWKELALGASFTLHDVQLKKPYFSHQTVPEFEPPPGELIEYLDRLTYIEDRLGWDLTLPENISERDLLDAEELSQILESGSYVRSFETLSFSFVPKKEIDFRAAFPPGEARFVKMVGEGTYELLDRKLESGLVKVLTAIIPDVEHKRIADQFQQGLDRIDVTFHQSPGSEGIRSYYPRYLKGKQREKFEKIHGKLDNEPPQLT